MDTMSVLYEHETCATAVSMNRVAIVLGYRAVSVGDWCNMPEEKTPKLHDSKSPET